MSQPDCMNRHAIYGGTMLGEAVLIQPANYFFSNWLCCFVLSNSGINLVMHSGQIPCENEKFE